MIADFIRRRAEKLSPILFRKDGKLDMEMKLRFEVKEGLGAMMVVVGLAFFTFFGWGATAWLATGDERLNTATTWNGVGFGAAMTVVGFFLLVSAYRQMHDADESSGKA